VETERKQPAARVPKEPAAKPANPLKPFREGAVPAERKPEQLSTPNPAEGAPQAQPPQPGTSGNSEPPANEDEPKAKKKAKPGRDREPQPAGLRKKQPAAE
jgi:hypothetical protein